MQLILAKIPSAAGHVYMRDASAETIQTFLLGILVMIASPKDFFSLSSVAPFLLHSPYYFDKSVNLRPLGESKAYISPKTVKSRSI